MLFCFLVCFSFLKLIYGIRLRRSIELQRGIVRVRTPTVGSSNIAWGETVAFSRLWRCPQRRLPWPAIPSTTALSRYKDRAAHTAPFVEPMPVVAAPGDTVSIPAIPSAVHRLFVWNLLAQLSSFVCFHTYGLKVELYYLLAESPHGWHLGVLLCSVYSMLHMAELKRSMCPCVKTASGSFAVFYLQ